MESYTETTMDELYEIAQNKKPEEVIIDVRTQGEFAEGHVGGSLNIAHDEIEDRATELKSFQKIYLYCRSGRRAEVAAGILKGMGFKTIIGVFDGGMPDWIAAGYPVER
jgi:rhodanese-related sulfurtransferase